MRIAIVCDYYLDYIGGAQSSILEQAAALEARGHDVLILSPVRSRRFRVVGRQRALEVRPAWTVPGLELPVVGTGSKLVTLVRDQLHELAVDVVHVQTEFGLAHAAVRAARQLGLPVVHTVHTFYWQATGTWQSPIAAVMRRALELLIGTRIAHRRLTRRPIDNLLRNLTLTMARSADVVISPSAHQANDLRAGGVQVPTVVVPNPVCAREQRPLPDSSRPRLAWIARCEPEKRPLVFVEAVLLARTRTAVPFEVDFVGDGSLLGAVRRRVHGVEGVRVHGALSRSSVLRIIGESSIVALTSHDFDNQPMTIAEAITGGRGVLYCDPRLEEGVATAGYLTSAADAHSIADAIVRLVESPLLVDQLASAATEAAPLFGTGAFVSAIEAAYDLAASIVACRVGVVTNSYTA